MKIPKFILPIIVISQFCCTSLWFAGNAVMEDIVINFNLQEIALGHLTSAVQFGFITGTLVFAIFTIADRFSPSKVFFVSALLAACFNFGVIWQENTLITLILLRFLTGFFLAGIYPIGMKIAADYHEKGLGKALGFLVGALVLGTAFPHFLKGIGESLQWELVLIVTTSIAGLGGLLMLMFVPNGPFRKSSKKLDLSAFFKVFQNTNFRSAAFGYFGHMWELYTFWAFVPVMLKTYSLLHPESNFNIPVLSFSIIGIGGLSCVLGSYLAQSWGTKQVAFLALLSSCICCLFSPWILNSSLSFLFLAFLFFWGMVVIADSPLFSTLVAQNATPEIKGTALTIVNCIGFSITIVSIQLMSILSQVLNTTFIYWLLAMGPILGLIALGGKVKIPKIT